MKKVILALATIALIAGCAKHKGSAPRPGSTDLIHFEPTTLHHPTKGSETTLLNLQNSADGFTVWATTADITTNWWEGSSLQHKYSGGLWNFDPVKQWPTDAAAYSMNFYAYFPDATGFAVTENATTQTASAAVTIQPLVANQTDFLSAQASTDIKPASGNLAMTFHHILSKINFGLDLGADFTASIQAVAVHSVGNTGTYTLTGVAGWTVAPSVYTSNYTYFGTYHAIPSGYTAILPTGDYTGNATNTTPLYNATSTPTAENANLMLMPQDAISRTWGGIAAPTALPTAAESYVSMIYRAQQSGTDLIGFAQAGSHPAFMGSLTEDSGYPATAPLFVKVAYPFVLTWLPGKGYTYNFAINGQDTTTGGYLIDQYYYDHFGNRTDLVVGDIDGDDTPDGPEVPDPLIDGDDIHLLPIVNDWDEDPLNVK